MIGDIKYPKKFRDVNNSKLFQFTAYFTIIIIIHIYRMSIKLLKENAIIQQPQAKLFSFGAESLRAMINFNINQSKSNLFLMIY